MSVVTVVPTVESSNVPPRIRLDVTDVGTSPAITATTVVRLDPDGVLRTVRTADGNPLILTTSGANRIGLLFDYEAPFGQAVSYSTAESPTVISAEVTVDSGSVWLIHPGVPELSTPIELRAGSLQEENWDVQRGVFWPMGRATAVVQTDGQRKAAASSMTVAVESLVQLAKLRSLVSDAGVLLLNIPASLGFGVDTCYIAIGSIRNRRLTDIGGDPYRDLEMPFQVVDRPVGGSQAERTYADVLAQYATYNAVMSGYPSYLAVLTGP